MLETLRQTAPSSPLAPNASQDLDAASASHPFEASTKVRVLDPSSLSDKLLQMYKHKVASSSRGGPPSVYSIAVLPSFGNTAKHSNGGHLGSIILNSCMAHRRAQPEPNGKGQDPLSITFDYLSATDMGEGYIIVTSTPRGSGRSGLCDLQADLYQFKNPDVEESLLHKVRATALFGTFSDKGPSAIDLDHFGPRPALEDTPATHPRSWYLPPNMTLISHHFNLLADLETGRRPRADYWIRFHPRGLTLQHHLAPPKSDGRCKRSLGLPLHSHTARRIDLIALPTIADLRRPAMENVLKEDPTSEFDEPTRKWAYPTLSLTLRFLRPLVNSHNQDGPEWMYIGWREMAYHGRVTSEFKMETEDGAVVCSGSMDSVMVPIDWYSNA